MEVRKVFLDFRVSKSMTQTFFSLSDTFCGENMHLTSYPISWSNVIETWYNESKYFNYGEWTSMDDVVTVEHYTQVIYRLANIHIA